MSESTDKGSLDGPELEGIAIDVEGTLADMHAAFLNVYNDEYDTEHTLDSLDCSYWNWVADELAGYDKFMDLSERAWTDGWEMPLLDPSADATIRHLSEAGFRVDIVTARIRCDDEITGWLAEHGITSYDEFHSIDPTSTKADLDYRYYVDDKPALVDQLREGQHQFVLSQPWNRGVEHPRATSVATVQAAADTILAREGSEVADE